jgi:hypothetical protein
MVCVLAYLLERLLEHRLEKAGLNLSAAEALGAASSLKAVKIELASKPSWRLTRPTDEPKHLLAKLGLDLPARLSLESPSWQKQRVNPWLAGLYFVSCRSRVRDLPIPVRKKAQGNP